MCFQRIREEPSGQIGVLSARNWTKFWTKFFNPARFSIPDRGGTRGCMDLPRSPKKLHTKPMGFLISTTSRLRAQGLRFGWHSTFGSFSFWGRRIGLGDCIGVNRESGLHWRFAGLILAITPKTRSMSTLPRNRQQVYAHSCRMLRVCLCLATISPLRRLLHFRRVAHRTPISPKKPAAPATSTPIVNHLLIDALRRAFSAADFYTLFPPQQIVTSTQGKLRSVLGEFCSRIPAVCRGTTRAALQASHLNRSHQDEILRLAQ